MRIFLTYRSELLMDAYKGNGETDTCKSKRTLSRAEVALRNGVIDRINGCGKYAFLDEKLGQRVMDLANRRNYSKGLRYALDALNKKSDKTSTADEMNSSRPTEVLSDSDANIDNRINLGSNFKEELEGLTKRIENGERLSPAEFLLAIENALGSNNENVDKSQYFKGKEDTTLRLANHRGSATMFLLHDHTTGNTSVVVKMSEKKFKKHKDVDLKEFVYFPDKMTPEVQQNIIEGLQNWGETGEYNQPCDKINESSMKDGVRLMKVGCYNPRAYISPVRGDWTKEKIKRRLKDLGGSLTGYSEAARLIAEFDSPEELAEHMFYHGTYYGGGALKPSILMSDRYVERYGGGGYGKKYFGISVSRSKKIASNFSTHEGVRIYPIILAKNAKVIEMPEATDSADLEDHITELWKQGVDAVWIGDKNKGEQELCVLNPKAIVNINSSDYYRYYKLGSEENPLPIIDNDGIEKLYDDALRFQEQKKNAPSGPIKPSRFVEGGQELKDEADYQKETEEYNKLLSEFKSSQEYKDWETAKSEAFRNIRFFRTPDGEAYGFTIGGKIYIDPRIADTETPVHEYTHLWSTALRAHNAKEWANVVNLMKGEKELWNGIRKNYPELKTDDEIADEVLAHYSGKRGAERLREEQRKIAEGEGSVFEKAQAISALERVRQAVSKFWKGVCDFLHIHYTSAEEVADRVMKDLLDGVNPTEFAMDNTMREQFIGEKGAKNLDTSEESTTRMDNLKVARDMEEANKDALTIRMGTGWERGADGRWRYEIPDFKLNTKLLHKYMENGMETDLITVIRDTSLFSVYPELEKTVIQFKKLGGGTSAFYSHKSNKITISLSDAPSDKEIRTALVHEIQHAIQHIEGFEHGTSTDAVKSLTQKADRFRTAQIRLQAQGLYRYDVSGKEMKMSKTAVKEMEKQVQKEYDVDPLTARLIAMTIRRVNVPEVVKQKTIDALVKKSHATPLQVRQAAASMHSLSNYGKTFDVYNAAMGEVEARNAEKRLGLSEAKRRSTLLSKTEDVNRNEQIPMSENGDESHMGSRTNKRMAEIGKYFENKELSDEERAIVDVFSGSKKRATVTFTNNDGVERQMEFTQGRETHAGTRHSIMRHFERGKSAFNADDILKINAALKQGEREEDGNKVVYTYNHSNGVKYTVVSEKGKSKENFVTFYTNKKASDSGVSYTQQSAHANLSDAFNAAKIENSFDTANPGDRERYSLREESAIAEKAKADGTYMKAPNGKRSNLDEHQWSQARTKAYKNWFGDWENDPKNASKVVDENGEPLVVYHGSGESTFNTFAKGDIGYHFGNYDQAMMRNYMTVDHMGVIRKFYLDIKNPLTIEGDAGNWHGNKLAEYLLSDDSVTAFGHERKGGKYVNPFTSEADTETLKEIASMEDTAASDKRMREFIESKGYDGIRYANEMETSPDENNDDHSYIAFRPNQIKSATDNVGTYDKRNNDIRYSLRSGQSVEEGNSDVLFRTSEELDNEYGDRWFSEQTNNDGRHSTQVKNTVNSYKKFGAWVRKDSQGRNVSVLDASSGLGLGTEALRNEGFAIDDVEPYPSSERPAPTFSDYADIDKKYDYVIGNAVLNVIPSDWRANVLHDMADKLKAGGKMLINVRSADSIRKQGIEGVTRITLDDASEILVLRPDGSIKAYQKGFTKEELKDWCEKELGEGYSVDIATKKNAGDGYDTAVVVTKNNESDTIGVASEASHPRRSAQALPNSTANVTRNLNIANGLDKILKRLLEHGVHIELVNYYDSLYSL